MSFGKRKRGRKPKLKALHLEEDYRKLEIVNKNGVVVDLEKLANAEDPFGEELRRRTVGMESEEALLGFMRELGGQWGSRRKKRKIVDAAAFGDALPVGWKLLLGIRRRDGRASIYCRRYIRCQFGWFLLELSSLAAISTLVLVSFASFRMKFLMNVRMICKCLITLGITTDK